MSTFHCNHCHREIFRTEDILETVNLWDLGDYQAECYAIRPPAGMDDLRRYDVSLHEGWYCCRFIMMRMTVDKFGTGDNLLVYKDAVEEFQPGHRPQPAKAHPALRLTSRDYDAVISAPENTGKLLVVRHGAIWCPPCRLMDSVVERAVDEGLLPDVQFFEVDVDTDDALARRWRNQSIPYTRFYRDGRQIPMTYPGLPSVDGGLVGGMRLDQLVQVCHAAMERAVA